jgi:hypothetical protein
MDYPLTKPILRFLKYTLPQINRLFQSESPEILKVYSEIRACLSTLISLSLKDDYARKLQPKLTHV